MNAVPLAIPPHLAERVAAAQVRGFVGAGNSELLDSPLLGLLASRACPAKVLIETLDLVPAWVGAVRVVVSGFHSPLEQQVLRSLLRRNGRAVKVLAHGITSYTPPEPTLELEAEALATGRLLVLTACAPTLKRATRATALQRNTLVLRLSTEICAPHIAPGSPLAGLIALHAPAQPRPRAE